MRSKRRGVLSSLLRPNPRAKKKVLIAMHVAKAPRRLKAQAACIKALQTQITTSTLQQLSVWASSVGIRLASHVSISRLKGEGRGNGLVADRAVKNGDVLISIPPAALLNETTTAAREALLPSSLDAVSMLSSTDRLILSLLAERCLGQRSKFAPYIAMLPPQPPVPLFWLPGERKRLQGTGVAASGSTEANDVRDHFTQTVRPFLDQHPQHWPGATFEDYCRAGSIVRAYSFHGDAQGDAGGEKAMHLVPFADILNHSTHRPGAHLSDDRASLTSTESLFGVGSAPPGTMVMRATGATRLGREVWNSYGELSNSQLLQRYGFVEEGNRHDTLAIRMGKHSAIWEGLELDAGDVCLRMSAARRLIRFSWGTSSVCRGADRSWSHLEVGMAEAVAAIPARLILVARIASLTTEGLNWLLGAIKEVAGNSSGGGGGGGEEGDAADLIEALLREAPNQAETVLMEAALAQRDALYETRLEQAEETLAGAPPGGRLWAAYTLRCSEGRILAALRGTVARTAAHPAGCWVPPVLSSRGGVDSATWP